MVKVWVWFALLAVRLSAETLTIATYNVENYTTADRMTEAGYRKEYPKPEAEKDALRAVILALNADILVLQEMGTTNYLEELARDLRTSGLDYPHTALLEGADADRHVALLAKRKPKSVTSHVDLDFPYFGGREKVKRGLLEATFATEGGDLTIFAVHLKSRYTDRADDPQSGIRRAAEATAVRDRVLRRFPEPVKADFVLLGDCNDSRDSKAVLHLLKRGKTEIMQLLPAADSRGESWTYSYHKDDSYSRVDHIFVSPSLRPRVAGNGAKIYDGPAVKAASDHRPVIVALSLGR